MVTLHSIVGGLADGTTRVVCHDCGQEIARFSLHGDLDVINLELDRGTEARRAQVCEAVQTTTPDPNGVFFREN